MSKILLKNVRLSFPVLFKAKAFEEGQNPKFSMQALMDPTDKAQAQNIKALQAAIVDCAQEKWGVKNCKDFKAVQKFLGRSKVALRNHEHDEKQYDSHEGMWYVAASNNEDRPPLVLDQYKKPCTAADDLIYAGCYVHVTVSFWAQDNKYGKRVNANLRAVMFAGDGERFGGGEPVTDDDFDDIEVSEVDADSLLDDEEGDELF